MIKYLYINGELAGEAEKIYIDEQKKQITGHNGDSDAPSFAMRGVKFENIIYEIKNEQGNPAEPDIPLMSQEDLEIEVASLWYELMKVV